MRPISKPTVKQLSSEAKKIYPQSSHLQRQWVKTTSYLYESGKHALMTGGWARGY